MAWIESHQELARHPKTKRAARLLGVSIPTMIGHLHMLWWWAVDFAEDGVLTGFDGLDIADAAMWEGEAGAFVDALTSVGFLEWRDETLAIHDWYEYAGKLIERREQNAQRMRDARAAKEKPRAKHVQRTFAARAGATVPNPTVPDLTEPSQSQGVSKPPRAPAPARKDEIHELIPFPAEFALDDEDTAWVREQKFPLPWVRNRTESFAETYTAKADNERVLNSLRGWKAKWRKFLLDDWAKEQRQVQRR